MNRLLAAALAIALALALAGCSTDQPATTAVEPAWRAVQLPTPAGPPGRIAVRDATSCGDDWYVVGAVIAADGGTRPAAWASADGQTWRSLRIDAHAYYARQAILSSVACHDGTAAAVGAKSGGAHGNPRTTSWYQRADGALVDMTAPFVLYGGGEAISVDRIAAGPDDWLIAGNRSGGAAVWVSHDATDFRLVDDDPALSSDPAHRTTALDTVHDGAGWTVVGRTEVPDRISPVPLAWMSSDGSHWQRQDVPSGTDGYADLERVTRSGDRLVAAGIRGERFGLWQRTDGRWRAEPAFGSLDRRATGAPFVSGLAATSSNLLVTASDGTRFGMWAETDGGWRPVVTPTRPTNNGAAQLTVAATGDTVLLLADDGRSGRVWRTTWTD